MKKWFDIPNYGELIPVDVFEEDCKAGSFIDYDGVGYYSDGRKFSHDYPAFPSDFRDGKINKRFKYVMWFNR